MAVYGPDTVVIQVDDSPGGTLRDISGQVRSINGIDIEALQQRTDGFGDSTEEFTPVGKNRLAPIVLTCDFDDTATTGVANVFADVDNSPSDATRSYDIAYGGTKQDTGECRFVKKRKLPSLDGITMVEITLQPSGDITET